MQFHHWSFHKTAISRKVIVFWNYAIVHEKETISAAIVSPHSIRKKGKALGEVGLLRLLQPLDATGLVVLFRLNMGPGREGSWQIIHKRLFHNTLATGSVPCVSATWKLINWAYQPRDVQIKELFFTAIVELGIHINLGGGREKFQSGEVETQICLGVDKQTSFSRCTEKSLWLLTKEHL